MLVLLHLLKSSNLKPVTTLLHILLAIKRHFTSIFNIFFFINFY